MELKWTLKTIPIDQLQEWSGNPRKISREDLDNLKQSFADFGHARTLTVSPEGKKYVIIGGNQSKKALLELGYTEISCSVASRPLTETEKRKLSIHLNHRIKGEGEWDFEILEGWNDVDFEEIGIDLPETQVSEAKEDNYEAPPLDEIKTDIVLGDLFEIGEHRLLCGDSIDSDQVEKLMNGMKADMVFTDPPYLMDFDGGMTTNPNGNWVKSFNSKHDSIKNDKMDKSKEADFLDSINENIQLFCNGAFYICFYRLKLGDYFSSLDRTGIKVRTLITWDKGNHTMSNSDYWSKCEHIFYGWVREHKFYGKSDYDIWEIARTSKNDLHPTMKPIPLCEKAISNSSKKSNIVLDLFLGSGSTMVASHQLNRKCYGIELEPKYCQIIIDRMIKLDPTLKIKKNGEPYAN